MEQNKENAGFDPVVVEEKKKENGFWNKAKKFGICALKVTGIAVVGAAAGYIARKYVDRDVYADAELQRQWRERKQGNSNNN